jgi:hypothetical protein
MRQFLFALVCVFAFSGVTHAAPGAVRCGKLLDVRSGQMLTDQAPSSMPRGQLARSALPLRQK